MSDDRNEEVPGDAQAPPSSLAPEVERLFDFDSPAWAARLRRALDPPAPGRLGGYQDLVEIGRGGQGEVYRAVQPGTGRVVALKRIAGLGLAPNPALLARFTREVDALTRLSHPNVVSVFAMEVIDGHSLLVMEFVDGRPIDTWADVRWKDGDRPLQGILRAFAEVCDGVAHAHQRGVMHRDLKPNNIMVTVDDRPKVLDFGIARVLSDQAIDGSRLPWTVTGFAGTPAYASPEQIAQDVNGIDTRTDVYSLGLVLFRMLTGEDARSSSSGTAGLLAAARAGIVRVPSGVRLGLPRECDWIVRKAADPDREQRYATVDALAEDVRRLMDGRAVLAHPRSTWYNIRRAVARRPWTAAGASAAIASVTALSAISTAQAIRLNTKSNELTAALKTAAEQQSRAEREEQRKAVLGERLLTATAGVMNNETYFVSSDVPLIDSLYKLVDGLTDEDDAGMVCELRMRLAFALSDKRRQIESEQQFALANSLSERVDEPTSERASRIVIRWSWTLRSLNRAEESRAIVERAIGRAAGHPPTMYSAVLHWERLFVLNALDRPTSELLECARELIRQCDAWPERVSERARSREESSMIARSRGEVAIAEQWIREALEIGEHGGLDGQSLSRFQAAIGDIHVANGRLEEGEVYLRAAVDFRRQYESATGSRTHAYGRHHAIVLHDLGRFKEAAERWELVLLWPLSGRTPDLQLASAINFRLAASRLGAGQRAAGMSALASAMSCGQTMDPDEPSIKDRVNAAARSLADNGWRIDDSVRRALGESSYLADSLLAPLVPSASAASPRSSLPPAPPPAPPDPDHK